MNSNLMPKRSFIPINSVRVYLFALACLVPSQLLIAQNVKSLLGESLSSPPASQNVLEKLAAKEVAYDTEPSADNLIWLGRFQAYSGDYQKAIDTYSRGIEQFPNDARIFRHRGHRYITIREFDKALSDFQRAVQLIQGQPNEIEPDGMPNPQNIPISTLQGNIYYHKGLAHYLKGDWPAALEAFQLCRKVGNNDDNQVSSSHWIYSTLQRMGRAQAAVNSLDLIKPDMNIIENHSYHRACLFYKGLISEEELMDGLENTPAGDSVRYAYANWLNTSGRDSEGKEQLKKLTGAAGWASFGHIAAEADLARQRK